jgi:hypothetical protein
VQESRSLPQVFRHSALLETALPYNLASDDVLKHPAMQARGSNRRTGIQDRRFSPSQSTQPEEVTQHRASEG